MLALFRRLTALRQQTPALSMGSYRSLDVSGAGTGTVAGATTRVAPTAGAVSMPTIFAYERRHANTHLLIVLNFGDEAHRLDLGSVARQGEAVLSTELDREGRESLARLELRANEGVIVRLADSC